MLRSLTQQGAAHVPHPLRRALSWYRTAALRLDRLANTALALACGAFLVAIVTSRFTPALQWLWTAILLVVIGTLAHGVGIALAQRREDAEDRRHVRRLESMAAQEDRALEEGRTR